MGFADAVACDHTAFQAAPVDPLLDGNMRFRFELQIALGRIFAVVIL